MGPHISRILLRTPASTPATTQSASRMSFSRNGYKNHPQRKQTPPHTDDKSQNNRLEKGQNGATRPPVNTSTGRLGKGQNGATKSPVDASTSRLEKGQNGATKAPVNASTIQNQQVWRPRSETKVDQNGSGDGYETPESREHGS